MEAVAYLESVIAGLIYLVAGARLYRFSVRTGGAPERLLSVSLVLWGCCYPLYNLPYALLDESMLTPFSFASRIVLHMGTIAFLLFTRKVFRSRERWATWLVAGTIVCLVAGVGGSARVGDWEGFYPLSNPWYWLEWVGRTAPMAWMGIEGFVQYRRARPRRRLGLCDPLVCNRFLLWSLTGMLWVFLELVIIAQNIDYEINQRWTSSLDFAVSLLELLPVVVIWFVFFPPVSYRNWIANRAAIADAAEGS